MGDDDAMKVKNYVVDRLLIVAFYVFLCVLSWIIFDRATAIVITITSCMGSVLMCYRVLLIPIDLLIGRKTEYAIFLRIVGVERIEVSTKSYCMEWKFDSENHNTLYLLNPEAYSFEDVYDCPFPDKERKTKISYLKLSKILLSWFDDE